MTILIRHTFYQASNPTMNQDDVHIMGDFEKLKESISKSGLPLEHWCIKELLKHGWSVLPSTTFVDRDENKYRELDMIASKRIDLGEVEGAPNWNYFLNLTLLIECKKSETQAWVFFPTLVDRGLERVEHVDFLEVTRVQSLAHGDSLAMRHPIVLGLKPSIILEPRLVGIETARSLPWLSELFEFGLNDFETLSHMKRVSAGRSIKYTGTNSKDDVYSSTMTVLKALSYEKEKTSEVFYILMSNFLRREAIIERPGYPLEICFLVPMIVFDGPLVSWQDEEQDLQNESCVLYQTIARSQNYFTSSALPVVKRSAFVQVLKRLDEDLNTLAHKMMKRKADLDAQIKVLLGN